MLKKTALTLAPIFLCSSILLSCNTNTQRPTSIAQERDILVESLIQAACQLGPSAIENVITYLNAFSQQTALEAAASGINATVFIGQIQAASHILQSVANKELFPNVCAASGGSILAATFQAQQILRGGSAYYFSNAEDVAAGATAVFNSLVLTYENALGNDPSATNIPVEIYNPIMDIFRKKSRSSALLPAAVQTTDTLFFKRNFLGSDAQPLYAIAYPMRYQGSDILICSDASGFTQAWIGYSNIYGTEILSTFVELLFLILSVDTVNPMPCVTQINPQ